MRRDLLGEFVIGKIELYTLVILSSAIVGANYYACLPDSVDYSSPLTYLTFLLMVLYFVLLVWLTFTKVKKLKDVNHSILEEKSLR